MADTLRISIQADLREPLSVLTQMGGEKPVMLRRIMGSVGSYAKKEVKRNYPTVLHNQTGYLKSTIRRVMMKNGTDVYLTAHNRSDTVRYGFVLAHGATILPKNGKSLLIKDKLTGVILAKKSMVVIPPKDFVEGPVVKYLGTQRFSSDLNKTTQKQIDKL